MSHTADTAEHDVKIARVLAWLDARGSTAVLLGSRRNFAWLTGGGRNGVDMGREPGVGRLLVRRDGRRFILSSVIERDRLAEEEVGRLGYESVSFPWQDEHANPATAIELARLHVGDPSGLVVDLPFAGIPNVEPEIMRLRASLLPEEVARYRSLGADAGARVADVCRRLTPGMRECEIAARVSDALGADGVRAPVLMVAADDRIRRYRHPVATDRRWERVIMVVVCAERGGLIVSLSRVVSAGAPEAALVGRTAATAEVFHRLAAATRPGATGRQLYDVAASAYAGVGFPGEEQRHHQGGATGYATRDWLAHPASQETIQPWQAFAWNPSITGSKVEDTFIRTPDGPEMITTSPNWPSLDRSCEAGVVRAPLVLAV